MKAAWEGFPYPIIVDTDMGDDIDDTWTVMLLLADKRFDVRMIVLTNFDTEYKLKLAAKMLERVNRTDIPIVVTPSQNIPRNFRYGQGRWIGDYDLEQYPGTVIRHGYLDAIKHQILDSPRKTCIFELAPSTTLAALLRYAPEVTERCFAYAMAGAINSSYETLDTVVGEFNIACDAEAARQVFQSDLDYTMLPLDVCAHIRVQGEQYRRFLSIRSVYADIIRENYRCWAEDAFFENQNDDTKASSILFDWIVPWYALYPENFRVTCSSIQIDERNVTALAADGTGSNIRWAERVENTAQMIDDSLAVLEAGGGP